MRSPKALFAGFLPVFALIPRAAMAAGGGEGGDPLMDRPLSPTMRRVLVDERNAVLAC